MDKNSLLLRKSRYVAGGTTEASKTAIEWWERSPLSQNDDDTLYVIQDADEGRLDLLAAFHYGESRLWWVIAQYNNILDPYNEVKVGLRIRIPKKERVEALFSSVLGGVPSQREVLPTVLPIV